MSSPRYTFRLFAVIALATIAFLLLTCGEKTVQPQQAPPPGSIVARFGASTTSGAPPLTVAFADSSTGSPDFWFWRFGDGNTSFDKSPSHVYDTAGTFTVILVVSRDDARDSVAKFDYIAVEDSAIIGAPVAQFTATPLNGSVPLNVAFTNNSSGTITSYSWQFGDGGISAIASPGHIYSEPGSYSVRLIVSGPGGADTLEQLDYIAVTETAPVAAFSASPTSGQPPLVVTFDNQSAGTITDYKWYFGDGDSSIMRNPSHSYNTAGAYDVTLIVNGPGGSDTLTITDYIAVSDGPPIAAFTGAPTSGIAPLNVQFTNSSAGAITSYQWSFGDGGTSVAANPSHQYAAAGLYAVRLIVVGPGGSDSSLKADYITVQSAPPVANFVGAPTTGIIPFTVNFTNQSTGDISSYQWSFGDGGTSAVVSPVHQYVAAGVYSVRLIVTGPGGVDTLIRTNYIAANYPPPVAAFTGNPTTGMVPLSVQFISTSTGQITSHSWTFGDGPTSTLQNPSHVYTTPGTYSVRLIVAGPGGVDTLIRPNYIVANYPPPVAAFTGNPTSGTIPLAVQFTSSSTGQISSYNWSFGDGGSSTQQNPSHTYLLPGRYDVRLIVVGPGGADTLLQPEYITANALAPVANFTADVTTGNQPLTVQFTDQSSGDITSWKWHFSPTDSSTQQNPSFAYTTAGIYDVLLIVVGPGGADTVIKAGYINVLPPKPVADFTGTPTSGDAPLTVNFTSNSTGNITNYEWEFGDGDISTVQNPSHVYTIAGVYDIQLKVTGPGGSDSITQVGYITVNIPRPVADFTGDPTSGVAPLDVQFTSTSTGEISTYRWNFGDGSSTTDVNPAHTYESSGSYNVRLIVEGPGGVDTLIRVAYISVASPPPIAAFEGTPTSGIAPLTVQFTDLSIGDITNYEWTFGDGGSSSAQNPSHEYVTPGTYRVELKVIGPGGQDTFERVNYISVATPPPTADFSGEPVSGAAPLFVTFTNASSGSIDTYLWDFGDGGTSTSSDPFRIYLSPGTYSVTLIVTGPGGADTLTRQDYIQANGPAPVADFSGEPTSGNVPLLVQFTNSSTGIILSQAWDFGDGETSLAVAPSHEYQAPGVYTVSLAVLAATGVDTLTRTDYITVVPPPPVAEFSADLTSGVAPLDVQFTDLSTGDISTYEWDFGDSTISSEASPLHSYLSTGVYTVKLTVTGPGGSNSATKVDYITVTATRGSAGSSR